MAWKRGEQIPTNLIVGFLGSGKTTAITKLLDHRPEEENWSVFVNEFGKVSIDHALVDSDSKEVTVEKLGGGCVCCTLSFAFKPLLAQFIRRTKPDRLILEPSGLSHPAKVVDILRSPDFASAIELKNIICLIDPKDFDDPRWNESDVFQDQVQLADIVVLNWTDCRDRELIDRCRAWVERFDPPKQLILETSFGSFDFELLDKALNTIRFPMFEDAHPAPTQTDGGSLPVLSAGPDEAVDEEDVDSVGNQHASKGNPLRFENDSAEYSACGWVFHPDDIFDRDRLLDLLGAPHAVARLKGVFRCANDWWMVNRAKEAISFATTTYRRDSRLEIIFGNISVDWQEFERKLLECLVEQEGS